MESLKLPMREVAKIYTKSELAIMAWRSNETLHLMDEAREEGQTRLPDHATGLGTPNNLLPEHMTPDSWLARIEERMGPVVHKIESIEENGQVDFRKLTGPEAMAYLRALSIDPGRVN